MKPTFVFTKQRKTFGRQCRFSNFHEVLVSIPSNHDELLENYVLENPTQKTTQLAQEFAHSEVNTERTEHSHRGMLHAQGGWPRDVNYLDEEQPVRYKRKLEKEESYIKDVGRLVGIGEKVVQENNAVNCFERYFDEETDKSGPPETRMEQIETFVDPHVAKRPLRHLSWSSEGASAISAVHSDLAGGPTDSYVWDLERPDAPSATFVPEFELMCLEFCVKHPKVLAGGLTNGQVAIWDCRTPQSPVGISEPEVSHRSVVNSVLWVNSKSGTEFFSGSSDGQVIFWDSRNFSEPVDVLLMDPIKTDEQQLSRSQGVSVLEYETTIPSKFMVGTEQGMIFSCNRKGKTPIEKINFKLNCHFGPVLSLCRNPSYLKTFVTVADWSAKIWSEDNRDNPIWWTKNHVSELTSGCWSANRCSLFFTTRSDGVLDAWDILVQQDRPLTYLKVCDESLRCIKAHPDSRILACGSDAGKLYLVQVSEYMQSSAKQDKGFLTSMMERESKREKILSDKMRELRLKLRTEASKPKDVEEATPSQLKQRAQEQLAKQCEAAEASFYEIIESEKTRRRVAYLGPEPEEADEAVEAAEEEEID